MDANTIIMNLQDKLPNDEALISNLRQNINDLSNEEKLNFTNKLTLLKLKNPSTGLAFSTGLGMFAVDRFYVGSYILGLLKLVCCLIFIINVICYLKGLIENIKLVRYFALIWYFADLFEIPRKIKESNYKKIMSIL